MDPVELAATSPVVSLDARRVSVGLWSSLLLLAAGHMAVDLCTGIWPVYKTMAKLDLSRAGVIATIAGIVGNGLQIVFGVMADRGWRKVLLMGGLVLSGAVLLVPHAHALPVLSGLVLATSVGSAAFHPTATGTASMLSTQRSGVMVGVFLTGGYIGYALSQIAFTSVYRHTGGATELLLLVPLLTAAAVASRVEPAPGRGGSLAAWKQAFAREWRSLGALFCIQVCASAINMGLVFLLPDFLLERGAPTWVLEGGGHAAFVLGGSLALLPSGYAADRLGARGVLVAQNVVAGVLFAWLLFGVGTTWSELAVLAAFGAANGANNVVLVSEGNRMLPGQASAVSALLMGLPWCVAAVAPAIVGRLAEPGHGGNTTSALGWLGITIAGAFAASLFVPKRRERIA
jgi:FSR family fosmidomycin resistance protein-like MFS transporter